MSNVLLGQIIASKYLTKVRSHISYEKTKKQQQQTTNIKYNNYNNYSGLLRLTRRDVAPESHQVRPE